LVLRRSVERRSRQTTPARGRGRRERRARDLTPQVQNDGEGFWDGKWKQVLVLPADGGEARQVTQEECDHVNPAWSPDGRWLAYAANPNPDADLTNVADIWVVPSEGGAAPRRLAGRRGRARHPRWPPA